MTVKPILPLIFLIGLLWPTLAFADFDLIPDRRDNPTNFDEGWAVLPIYSQVPGIGATYGLSLLDQHLWDTRMNLTGLYSIGNTTMAILGLTEVHLVQDNIVMHFYAYSTKIPFQVYQQGNSSSPSNYFYSVNKEYGGSAEIDLNVWERRIQLNTQMGTSRLDYYHIAGADGVIYPNKDGGEFPTFNPTIRFFMDFTDDYIDPREGFRFEGIRDQTLMWDGLHSDYYTLYAIATAYIPIHNSSTWAFNYFRSSAVMVNRNATSLTQLENLMSLNCPSFGNPTTNQNCNNVQTARAQERYNENQYGTAGQLGGPMELRGFELNRFHGSESEFFATEMRLNLYDTPTKFDFGFASGTMSIVQVAPFFEVGSVTDPGTSFAQAGLRADYGVGFRFGFSGAVLRADVGFSNEGQQFTFFVGYPWDMSPF